MSCTGSRAINASKPLLDLCVQSAEDERFTVEYEVIPSPSDYFKSGEIQQLRQRYQSVQKEMNELISERERLTSSVDLLDCEVSVACGIICGIIDIIFVGELDLAKAQSWGNEKINKVVLTIAKHTKGTNGECYKGNELKQAIQHLERKYGIPSDSVTAQFGGGRQHHLRDFAHHPSITGLAFSILTQFTKNAYGTDTLGNFIVVPISETTFIGQNIYEKLLFGIVYWFFHMVSDMAGSSSFSGAGTGLPGPILSLAKRLSSCPIFANADGANSFSLYVSKAFNGTLTAQKDVSGKIIKDTIHQIDLRTELGIAKQQAFPIILNEVLVRSFYFFSRVRREITNKSIHSLSQLNQMDWKICIPTQNRTIVRMLTISTSTFVALDLADAAIQAAPKSGGNLAAFAGQMLLRVNFVGVGRTVLAVGTEISMEAKRSNVQEQINRTLADEFLAYTELLRAERIELHHMVCWGIQIQIEEVNAISKALGEHDSAAVEQLTDQYMKKHNLDSQFKDFTQFQDFMINDGDDLII